MHLKRFSAGVCINRKIASVPKIPTSIRHSAITKEAKSTVWIAVFISPYRFAPKYWEITTEEPMLSPVAIATKRNVIEADAPTAASASAPT